RATRNFAFCFCLPTVCLVAFWAAFRFPVFLNHRALLCLRPDRWSSGSLSASTAARYTFQRQHTAPNQHRAERRAVLRGASELSFPSLASDFVRVVAYAYPAKYSRPSSRNQKPAAEKASSAHQT